MKYLQPLIGVAVTGLLLSGLSAVGFAQYPEKAPKSSMSQNHTSLTGCLSKDSSGNFVLTDEKTGTKTMVTGIADLEKHSGHKVTLTGTEKTGANGKATFDATKIHHLSASCSASSQ